MGLKNITKRRGTWNVTLVIPFNSASTQQTQPPGWKAMAFDATASLHLPLQPLPLRSASSHTISGVEDDGKSVPALSALALASSPSSFVWQGRKFSQLASGQGKPGSEQLLNIKALGPVSTWLAGKLKSYIHGSVVPSTLHSILHQLPLASVHPRKTCLLFFKE